MTALAAQGQARIDRMQLGGSAIAAAITLQRGDTAWFWKIAYNEGVARFSPGVQLVLRAHAGAGWRSRAWRGSIPAPPPTIR